MTDLQWYTCKKKKYENILKELRKEVKQNDKKAND